MHWGPRLVAGGATDRPRAMRWRPRLVAGGARHSTCMHVTAGKVGCQGGKAGSKLLEGSRQVRRFLAETECDHRRPIRDAGTPPPTDP